MASLLSTTRLRANLLQLPPSLRASLYANAPRHRSFSATPCRKLLGIDTAHITQLAVSAPTAVLDGFHAVGIPWCAAIPLTAIIARGILGYYLAVRPGRRRRDVRSLLHPITNARAQARWTEYRDRKLEESSRRGVQPPPLVKIAMLVRFYQLRLRETRHVGRDFGAPVFAWSSWFNFGVLVAFSEAVRIKCGVREGLLSLMFGPINRTVSEGNPKPPPPSDPAEALAERLTAANDARISKEEQFLSSDALPDGDALAQQIQLPSTSINPPPAYVDMTDPTMRLEGFSWIQDLTAPDPTMILPASLAFFMLANVFLRPVMMPEDNLKEAQEKLKKLDQSNDAAEDQQSAKGQYARLRQRDSASATPSTTNDVLHAMEVADKLSKEIQKKRQVGNPFANLTFQQRVTIGIAGYFFFLGCQLPAALVLYMASTLGTGWLQGRWLDVKYPPRKAILPCRKAVRYKIKGEYGDA